MPERARPRSDGLRALSAGSKPFFSDSPSTIAPPTPFANAEIVSAMLEGIFPTDSLTSTDWLSVHDDFSCRIAVLSSFASIRESLFSQLANFFSGFSKLFSKFVRVPFARGVIYRGERHKKSGRAVDPGDRGRASGADRASDADGARAKSCIRALCRCSPRLGRHWSE